MTARSLLYYKMVKERDIWRGGGGIKFSGSLRYVTFDGTIVKENTFMVIIYFVSI